MIRKLTKTLGAPSVGIAVLLTMFTIPAAFGADFVKGNIPFSFQVGNKTMPAGDYEIRIDLEREMVMVRSSAKKGTEAMEPIITYLASPAHSTATDADIVFDKVGNNYILSEVWRPGADGILVHATKGPHEHRVRHFKL